MNEFFRIKFTIKYCIVQSTIYWSLCLCCTLCKKTNLQKRTKLYVCSVYVRTYTVTWVLLKRQDVRKLILQLQSTQFYIQSQLKNTLLVYIAHKKLAEASFQSDSFSLLFPHGHMRIEKKSKVQNWIQRAYQEEKP